MGQEIPRSFFSLPKNIVLPCVLLLLESYLFGSGCLAEYFGRISFAKVAFVLCLILIHLSLPLPPVDYDWTVLLDTGSSCENKSVVCCFHVYACSYRCACNDQTCVMPRLLGADEREESADSIVLGEITHVENKSDLPLEDEASQDEDEDPIALGTPEHFDEGMDSAEEVLKSIVEGDEVAEEQGTDEEMEQPVGIEDDDHQAPINEDPLAADDDDDSDTEAGDPAERKDGGSISLELDDGDHTELDYDGEDAMGVSLHGSPMPVLQDGVAGKQPQVPLAGDETPPPGDEDEEQNSPSVPADQAAFLTTASTEQAMQESTALAPSTDATKLGTVAQPVSSR